MQKHMANLGVKKRPKKKKKQSAEEIEVETNTKMVSINVLKCLRDLFYSKNIHEATKSITFMKNVWKTDNVEVLSLITKQFYNNQGLLILVLCLKKYYEQSHKFVEVLLDTFYKIIAYDSDRCLTALLFFDAVLTVLDAVTFHCYTATAIPKGTFTDTSTDINDHDVKFLLSDSSDDEGKKKGGGEGTHSSQDRDKKNKALQLKGVAFLYLLSMREKEHSEKEGGKGKAASKKEITTIMECITFVIRTMKSHPRDMEIQQTCTLYLNAALNKILGGNRQPAASAQRSAGPAAVGESGDATTTAATGGAAAFEDGRTEDATMPAAHHDEDETSTIKEYLLVQKVDKLLYDAFDLFCGLAQNDGRGIDFKELATETLNRLLSSSGASGGSNNSASAPRPTDTNLATPNSS